MIEIVQNIVNNLLKDNNIFGQNGYYFDNLFEFKTKGIDDKYINQFYIRNISSGSRKYRISQKNKFKIAYITGKYRAVFNLRDIDKEKAMYSLIAQLSKYDNINIITFSDDSYGIYAEEYQKHSKKAIQLISIDFEVVQEKRLMDCNCLSIEKCCN